MENQGNESGSYKISWPRIFLIGLASLVVAEAFYVYGCMNKHKDYIPKDKIEQKKDAPAESNPVKNNYDLQRMYAPKTRAA